MEAVIWLVYTLLDLAWWLIVFSAVFSWLIAFNVVNLSNPFVRQVYEFLHQVTEPMLRPVRRVIPNLGTIDISPIIVLIGITFLQILWVDTVAPVLRGIVA